MLQRRSYHTEHGPRTVFPQTQRTKTRHNNNRYKNNKTKNKIYSKIYLSRSVSSVSHSASSVTVNIAYHQRSGFSPSFPFKAVLFPYYDIRYLVCPITILTPPQKNVSQVRKVFHFPHSRIRPVRRIPITNSSVLSLVRKPQVL